MFILVFDCRLANLLIHFDKEEDAKRVLKNEGLRYKDIEISIDAFSPKYTFSNVVPASARPVTFNERFNQILTGELSKQSALSAVELFDVLRRFDNVLHRKIQSPLDLLRCLMDSYSPYVHYHGGGDSAADWRNIQLSSYQKYPRRMPKSLQLQNVSSNVKNKAYYNDIAHFFGHLYPDGISLSQFRIEFVKNYDYIPAVPSLTEFLRSADIFSFFMGQDMMDLYLLPLHRFYDGETFKYPDENGIVIDGLPADFQTRLIDETDEGNCHVLRRGIDRFVIRYKERQRANDALQHIQNEGLTLVHDLPHLCGSVLTYLDSNTLY